MEIYLCDDNPVCLAELDRLARAVALETDEVFNCTSSEMLLHLLSSGSINNTCVVSDIELVRSGEGIRLAQEINCRFPHVPVILCTAYLNYARELWNADLCSFLTKPIEAAALRHTLEKARRALTRTFLCVSTREASRQILKTEIRYIVRQGRKSLLHLVSAPYLISANEPLDELLERLNSDDFCRIHRTCIVNLDYVKQLCGEELSLYGADIILTVSRPWQKSLLRALADHEGAKSSAFD